MAAAVKTSVTELPESRVRVEAEVPAEEVERRLEQTAKSLGRQMRIPGFRKGKVPPPVVIRRVGREAVLDEAVRGSLGNWYLDAIEAAGVAPVGDPKLDLERLPEEGQPLAFSIEIGVRPPARLGEYAGLEVGRRDPEIPDEAVDQEVEALRERHATLEPVDRPSEKGDFVLIDFTGSVDGGPLPGGEGRDELVELGAGRMAEEMDEELVGAAAGDERTIELSFPQDHAHEDLRGKTGVFEVAVKEVRAKRLPELDDDFAADAAGFDTLEDLRADVRTKLEEAEGRRIESEFREAAVDAAVAQAKVDVPDALVKARAAELWEQLGSTLERQGISKEAYMRISGKDEEQLLAEARPDAERALKREAVLAAIVEAEEIEPSDAELVEALEHSAEHEQTSPEKLVERLRKAGRLEALRTDLAARKAVDVLVESAKPIAAERAKAREKLWQPGQEEPEGAGAGPGRLWTPGS
jgi:trigger factor